MSRTFFFLASHDYVSSPEPRRCRILAERNVRPTGQRAYLVSVEPPIPVKSGDGPDTAAAVLLGMVDPTWDVGRVGVRNCMVDIYVPRHEPSVGGIDVKDLVRVGVGTLHSDASEAWAYSPVEAPVLGRRRAAEFLAREVNFLGEQEGEPEANLKQQIAQYLRGKHGVSRAYLARVNYGKNEGVSVALCLALHGKEEPSLQKDLGSIFASQFKPDEYLDVIVLSAEQERRIQEACRPFFVEGARSGGG